MHVMYMASKFNLVERKNTKKINQMVEIKSNRFPKDFSGNGKPTTNLKAC